MPALAFITCRHNLNSVAVLTGVLEADERTAALPLHFLWLDGRLMPRLRALADRTDRLALALSFATADLPSIAPLIAEVREMDRAPFVVAGGPHPSARPAEVLRLGADAVVVGEGEGTLPALLERFLSGESVAGLPGVFTTGAGGCQTLTGGAGLPRGPDAGTMNLDDSPPLGLKHHRLGAIEITRGCPCGCAFCQTSFLFGRQMRHRSVESVVAWVERAMKIGFDYARFVTPNAFAYQSEDQGRTVNLEAINQLLRQTAGLLGRERVYFGTFPSEVGPETVTPQAVELVCRHCGNDTLVFGAQTGSERLLRALHRRHTVADVYRATKVALDGGLTPVVDIIFGLPGEEAEDLAATVHLMDKLVAQGAVIHAHTFMPLPGTPLEDAPPGKVAPVLHPMLDRLASQGKLIGQWRRQGQIAER